MHNVIAEVSAPPSLGGKVRFDNKERETLVVFLVN